MKKSDLKYALAVAAMMAAIIVTQVILSRVFTYHTGEVFSRTAVSALFYYSIFMLWRKSRKAAC